MRVATTTESIMYAGGNMIHVTQITSARVAGKTIFHLTIHLGVMNVLAVPRTEIIPVPDYFKMFFIFSIY